MLSLSLYYFFVLFIIIIIIINTSNSKIYGQPVFTSNSFDAVFDEGTLTFDENINFVFSFGGDFSNGYNFYPTASFNTGGSCFPVVSVQFYFAVGTGATVDTMSGFYISFQPLSSLTTSPSLADVTNSPFAQQIAYPSEFISSYLIGTFSSYNVFLFSVTLPTPVDLCSLGSIVAGEGYFSVIAIPSPNNLNAYTTDFGWINLLDQTNSDVLWVYQQTPVPLVPPNNANEWCDYTTIFKGISSTYGSLTPAFQFNLINPIFPGASTCVFDSSIYSSYFDVISTPADSSDLISLNSYNNNYVVLASFDTSGDCFSVSKIQTYFNIPGKAPAITAIESVQVSFTTLTSFSSSNPPPFNPPFTSSATIPEVVPKYYPHPENVKKLFQQVVTIASGQISFHQVASTSYYFVTILLNTPINICDLNSAVAGTGFFSLNIITTTQPTTYSYGWAFESGSGPSSNNIVWYWNDGQPWTDVTATYITPAFELFGYNTLPTGSIGCADTSCYVVDTFIDRNNPNYAGDGTNVQFASGSWTIPYRANPNYAVRTGGESQSCIFGCLLFHHHGKVVGLAQDKLATIDVSFVHQPSFVTVSMNLYVGDISNQAILSLIMDKSQADEITIWSQTAMLGSGIFPPTGSVNSPIDITILVPVAISGGSTHSFTILVSTPPFTSIDLNVNSFKVQVC